MSHSGPWMIGAVLAALLLPGCGLLRPSPPSSAPAVKKDPFHDDKSFTKPLIQTKFEAEEFPAKRFEYSQQVPVPAPEPAPAARAPAAPASIPKEHRLAQSVPLEGPPLEGVPLEGPPLEHVKREPLADALQYILDNRHDEALRCLQAYDPQTQELFLGLLPALSILSKKKLTELSAAEVSVLHEQLHSLLGTLRPRTPLAIGKVCYCERVKGYGNYKPLPEGHAFAAPFGNRPGELVQLYVELRNFANAARHGAFETRFSSSVEICDSRGEPVWSYRFEDEKQPIRSRTQLNDWYNNYSFHVPRSLPPGVYRLTIQVADETLPDSRRVARHSLEFRVGPPVTRVVSN